MAIDRNNKGKGRRQRKTMLQHNEWKSKRTSHSNMCRTCFLLFCTLSILPKSCADEPLSFYYLPGLPTTTFSKVGDINIGAVVKLLDSSVTHPSETCSEQVTLSAVTIQSTEAIVFAVDLVNRSPKILPNVTLGFIMRGTCPNPSVTIANSLYFLPRSQQTCNGSESDSECSTHAMMSTDPSWVGHDVIGILGAARSSLTIPVSSMFSTGHVPIVGTVETSDDLSNKKNHPYFFRVVPPDMYQIDAILKFISVNGWSYISILYMDQNYGIKAYDSMKKNAEKYGICIATSHRLVEPPDYEAIVSDLLFHGRARVVVLFAWYTSFRLILQAVVNQNATGHFIWIGSDAAANYPGYQYDGITRDPAEGTFIFDLYTQYIPGFHTHLQNLDLSTTDNPWLKPVWEWLLDCSYEDDTCDTDGAALFFSEKWKEYQSSRLRIDAVLTFAQAAHNLLTDRCPGAKGEDARQCINGELLKEYLTKVTVDGFNGKVEFDVNQDVKGKYIIKQLVYDDQELSTPDGASGSEERRLVGKRIAVYDIKRNDITYFSESVRWSHLDILDRLVPWAEIQERNYNNNSSHLTLEMPESVCSGPCLVGEYKIEREVPCCWECRVCRENERLVDGNTSCEACPPFQWPDPATAFTLCRDIPPTYPLVTDTIPVIFISSASFALISTCCVAVLYAIYRDERVIKASSRELSVIQLVAILGGYTTIVIFQAKPTNTTCGIIFFSFCMSFSMLYSPLLVKTIRIFRIFRSGAKNERPKLISPQSQMVFSGTLIALQVALCTSTYMLFWPKAQRSQPIWSDKFVELSCDLTLPGLASFLGYNIVLVALCSVFAFMVRKLPDNFNESKFISMCVSTTLLIWLAFIPTYFTADREFIRTFLLSMALFLNHTVALMFLFVPKIYAAIFLPPETGKVSNNQS